MKASNKINIRLLYKLILGAFILFSIFLGLRKEIVQFFLINDILPDILGVIIFPATLLPPIIFALLAIKMAIIVIKKSNGESINDIFRQHFPIIGSICFIGSIILIIALCHLMELNLRNQVKRFLHEVSDNVKVSINGQFVEEPNQVVTELKKIIAIGRHGSHATKSIYIEVINQDKILKLELGRDSTNDQEYWIFFPKYRYTSKNEIGRIITDFFDDY